MSPAESATNSFALSQPIVSPEITQHRSAPSRVVARSRTVTMVPLGRSATSDESNSTPACRRALLPETTKTGAPGAAGAGSGASGAARLNQFDAG